MLLSSPRSRVLKGERDHSQKFLLRLLIGKQDVVYKADTILRTAGCGRAATLPMEAFSVTDRRSALMPSRSHTLCINPVGSGAEFS